MTTQITGLTGVSQVQDGSIVQADLGANVVGNGPTFSAYQSAAQSLAITTNVKLQFQTEEWDTANAFDSTTNYRFQPTVAGYYQVVGGFQVATTPTTVVLSLYKNGAQYKVLLYGNSTHVSAYGGCQVYLNGTTDYIELFAYQTAATQNTVAGITSTYFQAALVRAA